MTTLETWAHGKYMLACNSDDYSLVRLLKCQSPSRNLPHDLYSHKLWDNSKCICVSGTIVSTVLPSDKKFTISCKYECLGEVTVVTDLFLLECIGFDDCYVYLLAFKPSNLY